jgi:hypothetical protein
MIILERASKSGLTLRSPDEPFAEGAMVRLEIQHRMAVNDAMQDFTLRIVGMVEERLVTPSSIQYRVRARFCVPPNGMKLLGEEFDVF